MVLRKRHFAKAVTYRCFGTIATTAVVFGATGSLRLGASIGLIDSLAKVGLYYFHERLWYPVRWGIRTGTPGE